MRCGGVTKGRWGSPAAIGVDVALPRAVIRAVIAAVGAVVVDDGLRHGPALQGRVRVTRPAGNTRVRILLV